jgi:hypothetical protein
MIAGEERNMMGGAQQKLEDRQTDRQTHMSSSSDKTDFFFPVGFSLSDGAVK